MQKNVGIAGVTENIARIGTVRELAAGRHLVQQDIEQAAMVAVIGTDLVEAFFGTMEPLGKEIDIDGHPVKVIGVAEKKGAVFGESQDNFVWLPITTFQKFYGTRRSFSIQAEAQYDGGVRGGAGPGARGHARAAPPHLRQARRLQHRDRRERHGAVADDDPRHLRGDARGDRPSACWSAASW